MYNYRSEKKMPWYNYVLLALSIALVVYGFTAFFP